MSPAILGATPPLAAFAAFVFETQRFRSASVYYVDDPFISMRYAANLIARGEFSYNPGQRVEGYSNFLHVLIHALVFKLGGAIPDAAHAMDSAAVVVLVATLLWMALLGLLALGPGPRATAWYYAWILWTASWPIAFWATAGLETPIEGLFYVGILLAADRLGRQRPGGVALGAVLLAAVVLLRFEGVLVAFALAAAQAGYLIRAGRSRDAARLVAPVVAVAVGFHVWRLLYFGAILPNTFVAKATGGSTLARLHAGATYCGMWASFLGGGLWLALCVVALTSQRRPLRGAVQQLGDPVLLVACVLVATKVALVTWGGGDWMPGWRMLLPVTPVALFLLASVLLAAVDSERAEKPARGVALALALVVIVCGRGISPPFPERSSGPNEAGIFKRLPRDYVEMGRLIEKSFGPTHEEVAIGEAGLVPFEALDVPFMDLFGLVDPDMARQPGGMHNRVHAEHVMERAPAAVLFAHLCTAPPYGPYQYGPELLASRAFHAGYRLADVGEALERSGWALYLRRDLDPRAHGLAWAPQDPRAAELSPSVDTARN